MKSSFFLFAALLALQSCKNTDTASVEEGNISISLAGIEEYVADNTIKKASTSNSKNTSLGEVKSANGFDVITHIEVAAPLDRLKLAKEASTQPGISKLAAMKPMADSVRYRFVVYEGASTTPVLNQEIKTGATPVIRLNIGSTYKWVVYSINRSTVPTITNNILNKNDIANKDFLYATGNLTVQNGINKIPVLLKRYTTQYVVNVDSRGMFAKMKNETKISLENGANKMFKKANFDIFAGDNVAGSLEAFDIESSTLTPIDGFEEKKSATFYTLDRSVPTANSLSLTFKPLVVLLDDAVTTRTFNESKVSLTHNSLVGGATAPITDTRGRRYTISTTLVESGIQVGTSSTVWARSNLWYDANNATARYRFRPSPHYRDLINKNNLNILSDPNDLWRFNTRTPAADVQVAGYDPCNDVYPTGLWKMPSDTDFTQLANSNPNNLYLLDRREPWVPGLLGLVGNSKYYEILAVWNNADQTNLGADGYGQSYRTDDPNSTMNNLSFTGIGYENLYNDIFYRPVSSSVLSVGELLTVLPVVTGGGHYWTSKDISPTSVVVKPHYFKFGVNGAGLLSANVLELIKLSVLKFNGYNQSVTDDVLVGATTLLRDNWKSKLNIRCVRNSAYGK